MDISEFIDSIRNAHVLRLRSASESNHALMHTLICLNKTCNPASAGPSNKIWAFEAIFTFLKMLCGYYALCDKIPYTLHPVPYTC